MHPVPSYCHIWLYYHYYIASLHHKIFQDSVKGATFETCWFIESLKFSRAHLTKVFSGLWNYISKQLHFNSSLSHSAFKYIIIIDTYGNIEKYYGIGLFGLHNYNLNFILSRVYICKLSSFYFVHLSAISLPECHISCLQFIFDYSDIHSPYLG